MKLISLLSLLILTSSVEWLADFEKAKAAATESNKYILLNFSGSDWCAPCIKLKKEVFTSEAFNTIARERLILLGADFPRSKKNQLSKEQINHNEKLAEKYNPNGKFPLTLLLDKNGQIMKEWDGYVSGSEAKFMSDLKQTLSLR
jgi:thioredoxin-related protein